MENTRPIGIGVIGCGKITATRHVPEYAKNSDCRLVGYFDFVKERAEALAAEYGGTVFSSVEELLACDEIGAVSVCTANATHAEITIAALAHGKHVLCEKPMATTLEECRAMVSAATAADRRLMVAQNQRLAPVHTRARALIAEGAIGTPLSVKTCFGHSGPDNWSVDPGTGNWFFDRAKSAFGAMADLGVHKIDLVRYLLDDDMQSVTAMLAVLDKKDSAGNPVSVEDHAAAIYRMARGAIVTMTASWTYYGEEDNDTAVYGTKGILKLAPADGRLTLIPSVGAATVYEGLTANTSGVIDAFVSAVTSNTPSPIDAQGILPSMHALLATIEAAEEGRTITL